MTNQQRAAAINSFLLGCVVTLSHAVILWWLWNHGVREQFPQMPAVHYLFAVAAIVIPRGILWSLRIIK